MNALTQTTKAETPDDRIYQFVAEFWGCIHDAVLDPAKTAHAFRSLWHGDIAGAKGFIEDFCEEFGEFDYELSRPYTYGDHPDYGGGLTCVDIESCSFTPHTVKRADITRVLGPDVLDWLDEYGLENHEIYGVQE